MSLKYAKRFFCCLLFLSPCHAVVAQNSNKENIPYTRFGIGDLQTGTNVMTRGMGYQTAAFVSPVAVNSENPASYASLRLTTYEIGLSGSSRTLRSGGEEYTTGTASLSYLNIGIPVGKHAGINLGLKPQSRVYYRIEQDSVIPDLGGTNSYVYSGDGGLNYAFIGAAGTYGGFSIGVNFGYLFGTTRYSSVLQQTGTDEVLSSEFSRYDKTGGVYWSSGALYETPLSEKLKLRLGATFTLNQELNITRDDYRINFRTLGGVIDRDTSYNNIDNKGTVVMPASYGFGVQLLGNEVWSAGADFSLTQWNQYRSFNLTDSVNDRAMRISVGGAFTPNPTSLRQYFQRVTYRAGFYYGTDYVRLRQTDINYYAVTLGASLPFRRTTDRIHTAFEIGRRGTEANGLIRENFYRFTLGLSLNDRWFVKRKYD